MSTTKYMETTTSLPVSIKLLQFFFKILRIWLDVYFKTYGWECLLQNEKETKRRWGWFGDLRIPWEVYGIVLIFSPYGFVSLHWNNDNNKNKKN